MSARPARGDPHDGRMAVQRSGDGASRRPESEASLGNALSGWLMKPHGINSDRVSAAERGWAQISTSVVTPDSRPDFFENSFPPELIDACKALLPPDALAKEIGSTMDLRSKGPLPPSTSHRRAAPYMCNQHCRAGGCWYRRSPRHPLPPRRDDDLCRADVFNQALARAKAYEQRQLAEHQLRTSVLPSTMQPPVLPR